jgi:hypothetical protein
VVLDARQVFDATSPNQNHAVLLKIVAFARYVGVHLAEIAESNAAILSQR